MDAVVGTADGMVITIGVMLVLEVVEDTTADVEEDAVDAADETTAVLLGPPTQGITSM